MKRVFEGFGAVSSVIIKMKDHKVKSRGFGFVEMPDALQAQAAIAALNGKELMGRPLKVDPARVETDADRKRPEKKEGYQHRKAKEKKPWRGSKPWEKRSGSARGGESKPWKKGEGEAKPWKKRKPGFKPWEKSRQSPHGTWKNRKSHTTRKNA